MLFPEKDAAQLKAWIVKHLETPERSESDVDADVLADYVLALLRHDGRAEDVRKLCETELYDFLKDDAKPFVATVFQAVASKAYRPGAPPLSKPKATPARKPTAALDAAAQALKEAAAQSVAKARKRSFYESSLASPAPTSGPAQGPAQGPAHGPTHTQDHWNEAYMMSGFLDAAAGSSGRALKQARRGRGGRGGRAVSSAGGASLPLNMAGMGDAPSPLAPLAPLGVPPLSLETFMQMSQMGLPMPMYDFSAGAVGGLPPPSLPLPLPLPPWTGGGGSLKRPKRSKRKCRNIAKKGYCKKPNCPFNHDDGKEVIYLSDDSTDSEDRVAEGMAVIAKLEAKIARIKAEKASQKGKRSSFSERGPVYERQNTAIVVEGIPPAYLSETAVRDFFSTFGTIESITIQPQKMLAVVQFATWEEANSAYQSPKVVFENRFVKVYWHKAAGGAEEGGNGADATHGVDGTGEGEDGEPELDMDEFLRQQEEAQRRYEEKQQKKQELDDRRQELEEKQRALLARQQEEKQRLIVKMAALATRTRQQDSSETGTPSEGAEDGKISQTEVIRAQLAALEEEARQLGIDPDSIGGGGGSVYSPTPRGRGQGRGRGRGGIFRGGFRGGSFRGGSTSALHSAYAAYSLDNRPRRVAITGADFTVPDQDECLRQYLLGVGDYVAMDTTPETTTITFTDRKTAEKFFYGLAAAGGSEVRGDGTAQRRMLPGVEPPLELSWVAGAVPSTGASSLAGSHNTKSSNSGSSSKDNTGSTKPAGAVGFSSRKNEGAHAYMPLEEGELDEDDVGLDVSMDAEADQKQRRQPGRHQMDFDIADDWDME